MNTKFKWIMSFFLLLLSFCNHANVFNIVPKAPLPTSVTKGSSVKAYYTVTNTTGRFHAGNYVKYLPPNVSQVKADSTVPNLCGATFALASRASCTLELNVTGAVNGNDPNPNHHLFVCLGGCVTCCAGTLFPLNVTQSSAAVLLSIAITPTPVSIVSGGTQQYVAIGTYSNGTTANISSSVVWSSSNTNIATITSGGLASGVSPGSVTIKASLNSITSNNAILTVVSTPTISATNPIDQSTNVPVSTNIAITFSIPMKTSTLIPSNFRLYNPVGATYVTLTNPIYSNSNKTVTFNTNTPLGSSTVYQIIIPAPENIKSADGVALSTGGTISSFTTASAAVRLSSIAITPTPVTIASGGTQQYVAIGTYSNGTTANISSSVVWSSSNTNIATITSGGLASGVSLGSVTIKASLNSITSNNAILTVVSTPTVSATNPIDQSTNVPVSTNIVITFSIPMNTSTLIPSNFNLYNPGGSTYVTLTNPIYSNSNKTVTFNTNAPLSSSTVYQIIIPAPENVKSADGVALSSGGTISSFTTALAGSLCAQTWVLNAGNNTLSACSSDSVSGAIVSCTGSNVAVTGDPLSNPTAMIWNGLLLSITNASGSNPLVVIDTVSNPSPPFTASATGSNTSSPSSLAALNGFGWIANGDSTLTYCTSAQTGNAWSGCNVATPANYPAITTNISVISGVLSNPNAAGVLYTANTSSNSISACLITNSITIPTCTDAGGSGFNQPTFVAGRIVSFGSSYYVLIANKGNSTVLRCTFDNQTFMLSNCTPTGSNFNQPVSIYEADNGFAYITNQVDNSITICTDTDGVLTNCNNTGGDFNAPVAAIVGSCS